MAEASVSLLFPAGDRTPWAVLARTLHANPRSFGCPRESPLLPQMEGAQMTSSRGLWLKWGAFMGSMSRQGSGSYQD